MRQADITRAEGRRRRSCSRPRAAGKPPSATRRRVERSAQAEATATQHDERGDRRPATSPRSTISIAEKYVRRAARRSRSRPTRRLFIVPMELAVAGRHARGHRPDRRGRVRRERRRASGRGRRAPAAPDLAAHAATRAAAELGEATVPHRFGPVAGRRPGAGAAETLVPGAFLIWIGVAAVVVGAVEFVYPVALEIRRCSPSRRWSWCSSSSASASTARSRPARRPCPSAAPRR